MFRAIATYPVLKIARMTAMTMNAAGIPVSPVAAYAVGMTPAATVSGATDAMMKLRTVITPSRSRASVRDTRRGRAAPDASSSDLNIAISSEWLERGPRPSALPAVGQQGGVHRGPGLGDQ